MKSIRNAGRLQQPGGGLRVNSLSVLSCVVLMTLGSCASPYDGTPKTLGLVPVLPTRFPVVALTAGQPALIQSTGRQGDDASNPVHQFGSLFDLNLNVLGAPQDFAANTSTTLLASGRPDLSGSNDSLVADASGQGTALWFASNASGKYEVYASRYLTNSGWVAKDLLATSSFSVVDHRVAMNGIGGAPWGVLVAVLAVAPFYMAISRNCFVFKWLGIHSLSAHELEQYGDPYAG